MISETVRAVRSAVAVAAPSPGGGVPNPGGGVAPPGSVKFLLVLQWGAWLVTVTCVAGILYVAATMALRHRRGEGGGEAASGLVWVLVACVLASSAGPIVAAVFQ